MMKMLLGVALMVSLPCMAGDDLVTIQDSKKIAELLKTIPNNDKSMPYVSIADRLPNLGLSVNQVIGGKMQPDEIKDSQGRFKKGDALYQFFFAAEPNNVVKAICPISRQFSLIKRGKSWLPYDRTSNFLMNGNAKCFPPA